MLIIADRRDTRVAHAGIKLSFPENGAKMYSIDGSGGLTPLVETPYALEIDLQRIVASHPTLLAGDQMDAAAPRHFALMTSEAGIATSEDSAAVFALDLLYVDQDAILTLVEVKRSSDTRLRREVIGQILEYAANVCAFWSADKIRFGFEQRFRGTDETAEDHLQSVLSLAAGSYEEFWLALQSNLDQNRLRLVIVADKISVETMRIIEYLNRQMTSTDVFGVSVSQFTGGGVRTLTPRVLNPSVTQTERKVATSRSGATWTRERFFEALAVGQPPKAAETFETILKWSESKEQVQVFFGNGLREGSMPIKFRPNPGPQRYQTGVDAVFLTLFTYGAVEIGLQYLANFDPFHEDSARLELVRRLNRIGLAIPEANIRKRPNIPWTALADQSTMHSFLEIQDWVVSVASGIASI